MKIQNNHIYCIIPFYITKKSWLPNPGIWLPDSPKLDQHAIYSFIEGHDSGMTVYRIDPDRCLSLLKLWRCTSEINIGDSTLSVRLLNERNWLTPRLAISRSRRVGFLSIPLSVDSPASADDIVRFVNIFHKYDSGQGRRLSLSVKHSAPRAELAAALGYLPDDWDASWTLRDLIACLLPDPDALTPFTPHRAIMFTRLTAAEGTPLVLDADAQNTILRLMHCHDAKYLPVPDAFRAEGVTQTFANMYTGIASEGACILSILSGTPADYFQRDFPTGNFQTRYLWLYFIALMQRLILLDIERTLAHRDAARFSDRSQREILSHICHTRVTGFFSSLSPYSHLNSLYAYFIDALGVRDLYDDVDTKLRLIDTSRHARFEQFVKLCGVVLALLALLYGLPQSLMAVHDAGDKAPLWLWAWLSMIPAAIGFLWILLFMLRKK